MAWTAPRTWADGEAVTSSMFNTHIRDLFRFMADEPHECWVTRTSDATITTGTETTVSWQKADRNVGLMWKVGSAANVTIKQEGLYGITMNAQWVALSTGYTFCGVKIGGTATFGNGDDGTAVNNSTQQRSCHAILELQPGAVVTGFVYHSQGSNGTLQGGINPGTHLKVTQVKRRAV